MLVSVRTWIALIALTWIAPIASAQRGPLETGRQRVREGRYEEAFEYLRAAAAQNEEPAVLLELAEVADRLRLDAIALEAYERYLIRARPDAANRAEIEGRVRVLRELAAGGRYVLEGPRTRLTREERATNNVLVDWYGRPLVLRRSSGVIALADWDGALQNGPARVPDLVPFPGASAERNLGRRLARPRRR
jgi:hypothetical protein